MIINMSGGAGGSGATLTVNSSGSGTVTVSNATIGKSYSKPVVAGGAVQFKGLATGTWTVVLSDGSQTTTQTVSITADYNLSVAYFAATINVTYPAGSVCTATNGNTTLRAPNTSGSWSIVVPTTGTWTISSTDGVTTATEAVTISRDGQTASVTLTYSLILYSPGDEHTAVTGGWRVYQNATISRKSEYLQITPTRQYDGNQAVVGCTNMIDLTDINVLYAEAKNNCSEAEYLGFVVYDSQLEQKAVTWWAANQNTTKSLNVANLTGTYYVGFEVYWGGTVKGSGLIYNVWGD